MQCGAKKCAEKKGGAKKSAGKKSGGKKPRVQSTAAKLFAQAKDVAVDVLSGAGVGALVGAVKGGAERLEEAAGVDEVTKTSGKK